MILPHRPQPLAPPLWLRLCFYLIAAAFMAAPVVLLLIPEARA